MHAKFRQMCSTNVLHGTFRPICPQSNVPSLKSLKLLSTRKFRAYLRKQLTQMQAPSRVKNGMFLLHWWQKNFGRGFGLRRGPCGLRRDLVVGDSGFETGPASGMAIDAGWASKPFERLKLARKLKIMIRSLRIAQRVRMIRCKKSSKGSVCQV